ncbi:hypothetical protein HMPREF9447_00326 [Bacteroides oleiciplenus YIT 12058]|uniref:Uncharacterized protein n=1 Tax=Bacteroides oleiciplenus YIT 12058 TaxID=742727 RepID=K9E657_9BACE|nr:hypothetical protein HMPREF9447_00326 [Bacteroides oleiciplenus YIT 12058]
MLFPAYICANIRTKNNIYNENNKTDISVTGICNLYK